MSSRHEVYQTTISAVTTATDSAAFAHDCRKIRVATSVEAYFTIHDGTANSASPTNGAVLTPGCVDYVTVTPGQKASVFLTAAGRFSITEMSS